MGRGLHSETVELVVSCVEFVHRGKRYDDFVLVQRFRRLSLLGECDLVERSKGRDGAHIVGRDRRLQCRRGLSVLFHDGRFWSRLWRHELRHFFRDVVLVKVSSVRTQALTHRGDEIEVVNTKTATLFATEELVSQTEPREAGYEPLLDFALSAEDDLVDRCGDGREALDSEGTDGFEAPLGGETEDSGPVFDRVDIAFFEVSIIMIEMSVEAQGGNVLTEGKARKGMRRTRGVRCPSTRGKTLQML